jgi:hypothetical protein
VEWAGVSLRLVLFRVFSVIRARYVATRKRFNSEQSIWATDWIRKNANFSVMRPGWTYLFEIIYPDNRVIIQYPHSGYLPPHFESYLFIYDRLVLLACVSPTGDELGHADLIDLAGLSIKYSTLLFKL